MIGEHDKVPNGTPDNLAMIVDPVEVSTHVIARTGAGSIEGGEDALNIHETVLR